MQLEKLIFFFKEARQTKQCLEQPVKLVSRLPTYNGIVAASRESIYFFIVIVINKVIIRSKILKSDFIKDNHFLWGWVKYLME